MASCNSTLYMLAIMLCLWSSNTANGFVVPNEVRGYTGASTERDFSPRGAGARISMYMPPSSTSQTPPMSAQKMLATPGVLAPISKQHSRGGSTPLSLSPSVLASCDTLPSFHTAHGLLSPETVSRLEKLTNPEDRSKALNLFLTTYRRDGPMSCLKMLSDPDILPHLTTAMRDLLA